MRANERIRYFLANGEQGSVMVLVLTILMALLAAAGTMLYLQMANTRSAGMVAWSIRSRYCAEGGLVAAAAIVGANYLDWQQILDGDPRTDPAWYPVEGDLNGDGESDYQVTLRDNDDELPPLANDPTRDNDMQVFLVSRCIHNPETPYQVTELLAYTGGGAIHRDMLGFGPSSMGNKN